MALTLPNDYIFFRATSLGFEHESTGTDFELNIDMFCDDNDDDLYDDLKIETNIFADKNKEMNEVVEFNDENMMSSLCKKVNNWKVEDLFKNYSLRIEADINENDESYDDGELPINVEYPTDLNFTIGLNNDFENIVADTTINYQSEVSMMKSRASFENDVTTQRNTDFEESVEYNVSHINEDLDKVSLVKAILDVENGAATLSNDVSLAEENIQLENLDTVCLAEVDVNVEDDVSYEEHIFQAKEYYKNEESTEDIDLINQKMVVENVKFENRSFDNENLMEGTRSESIDDITKVGLNENAFSYNNNISFAESDKETVVECETSRDTNKLINKEEYDKRMHDFENSEDFWNNNLSDDSFDQDMQLVMKNKNFEYNQSRFYEDNDNENELNKMDDNNDINVFERENDNNNDTYSNDDIFEHEWIKPLELKIGGNMEVAITDFSSFPDLFLVVPAENFKTFQE